MPIASIRRHAEPDSALLELAELCGVTANYIDSTGQPQQASREALTGALRALGVELDSGASEAIQARRAALRGCVLPPTLVAWDGALEALQLRLPQGSAWLERGAQWQITLQREDGAAYTVLLSAGEIAVASDPDFAGTVLARLPIGMRLPQGYHGVAVEAGAGRRKLRQQATVIAAPTRCYAPPGREAKSWGVFLPLYALRSRRDWGTGDFASLARLHEWTRARGGQWTGTLPLLAAFLDQPFEPSPYMPVSRLFWNELFIAPEAEAEFTRSTEAQRIANSKHWREELRDLHRAHYVNYSAAMRLKRRVLEAMARQMLRESGARREAFEQFARTQSQLHEYARFRATVEHRGKSWRHWPERMRRGELRADGPNASAEHYHYYAQWLAETQLARMGKGAAGGGLYLDFPLGVHPDGYDVWRNQHLFAEGAAAGAPPDELFPDGQNWAFPPLHPEASRQDGYRYLRETLRHQMRHAGMLRVDHVMGLNRLYWIPRGIATRDGVYVQYPAEEMYAVLSLESHRARCVVVGENLGTVPETTTQAMRRHGARGMHILQFGISARSRSPLAEPAAGEVASLNTHDTPPLAGFLAGKDIKDFARLGVFSTERARQKLAERRESLIALKRALRVHGPQRAEYLQLLAGCLKHLGDSAASAVIVNLEDLWGEREPQNIPGTGPGTEHPAQRNWQRKARRSIEQIVASRQLAALLRKALGGRGITLSNTRNESSNGGGRQRV